MPLSLREIVSLSPHRTYPDTGIVHNQFMVQKVQSGVFINYLELGFLHMFNCSWPLATQEEGTAFATSNSEASVLPMQRDVNMKVLTVSWKPKAVTVVIERFVVRHKSGNFCSQLLFNRQQNFRLCSCASGPLYRWLIQNNIAAYRFYCRISLFSHYCAMFYRIRYQILSRFKFWNREFDVLQE